MTHTEIKPKFKWRETFHAIQSSEKEYYEHNGKKFEVIKDITDPFYKTAEGEEEYGYVRVYEIKLEDDTIIHAFENEVELFQEEGVVK